MELRAFWAVITRWKWVVLTVTIASVIASGALVLISPPGYKARVMLAFSAPPPPANTSLPGFDEQNRFLYAEQVVEDFTKIVAGRTFADNVAKRLPFPMDPRQIQKGWTAKKQAHHILSLEGSAPTEMEAVALLKAASDEIVQDGQTYYKALNTPELSVTVIDPASSEGITGRLLDLLFVIGRVVVGVIVGLGLAFLLDYLDDHVNTAAEAEELGFRVIGAIPKASASKQRAAAFFSNNGSKPRAEQPAGSERQ